VLFQRGDSIAGSTSMLATIDSIGQIESCPRSSSYPYEID